MPAAAMPDLAEDTASTDAKPSLFISYAHRDTNPDLWRDGRRPGWDAEGFGQRLEGLIERLTARGIEVFWDRTHLDDFDSIKSFMQTNLPRSRAMLTFYSTIYPGRRACQWELTAAYIAGCADAREGERPADAVERRILVLNPETDKAHILPEDLTERLFADLSGKTDLDALADKIAKRLNSVTTPMASARPDPAQQLRIGENLRMTPSRFVGRIREMWRLHSVLAADNVILRSPSAGGMSGASGAVILSGLGGMGKSMLALEYALRFANAWPGGLIWLYAGGDDAMQGGDTAKAPDEPLLRDRLNQSYRSIALELGLKIEGLEPDVIVAMTRRALSDRGAYLWIVDDLPSGVSAEIVKRWAAPSANGASLFTTRDRRQTGLGAAIALEVLDDEAAWDLLTALSPPQTEAEISAAQEILKALGHHALALDVAGHLLGKHFTWEEFHDILSDPKADAFDLAREIGLELPNGHEVGIVETLMLSLRRLPEPALAMLGIACQMAPNTPIPRDFLTACFVRYQDDPATEEPTDEIPPAQKMTRVSGKQNLATRAAIGQCANLSLIEADPASIVVHPVVKRVMQLTIDPDMATLQRRSSMVEMVAWLAGRVEDIREHKDIAALIPLAEALGESGHGLVETSLLLCIGGFSDAAGDYVIARNSFNNAVISCKGLLDETHPQTLSAVNNLARILLTQGDLNGARALQETVLERRKDILGDTHPDTLMTMNNLAGILLAQGDLNEARALLETVLEHSKDILGDTHPDTLTEMNNLAKTLYSQGHLNRARALIETVLERFKDILGETHPDTLTALNNLARTLYSQGDLNGARALLETALEKRRDILGETHPHTLFAMTFLGICHGEQGRLQDAKFLLLKAVEKSKNVLGEDHHETLVAIYHLALTLHDLGDFDGARIWQESLIAKFQKTSGEDHEFTLRAKQNLARMLIACGEKDEARRLAESILTVWLKNPPPNKAWLDELKTFLAEF